MISCPKRGPKLDEKENTMSNFYIVERNGTPAIWQVGPDGIVSLIKRKSKAGYSMVLEPPFASRSEALTKLCQMFPNVRRAKTQVQISE